MLAKRSRTGPPSLLISVPLEGTPHFSIDALTSAEESWKGLRADLLRTAGVRTHRDGLTSAPYRLRDGSLYTVRVFAPNGRCWWRTRGVSVIPFGIETLPAEGQEGDYTLIVCEGESDTIAARSVFRDDEHFCVIGLPGARSWKSEWADGLAAFGTVYVVGDGDAPGRAMNQSIVRDVPAAIPVWLGEGRDVRYVVQRESAEAFRQLLADAAWARRVFGAIVECDTLEAAEAVIAA